MSKEEQKMWKKMTKNSPHLKDYYSGIKILKGGGIFGIAKFSYLWQLHVEKSIKEAS